MVIQESAENYLETILMLKREQGKVRSIDIVHAMNYSLSLIHISEPTRH